MKKFDKAQKNIATALTIWIIVCLAVITAALIPQLQEHQKYIIIGFAVVSALWAAITSAYAKKMFHQASVTESQLDFLSIKGATDRLNSDDIDKARSDADDNNEEIKQEKARQEKQRIAHSERNKTAYDKCPESVFIDFARNKPDFFGSQMFSEGFNLAGTLGN